MGLATGTNLFPVRASFQLLPFSFVFKKEDSKAFSVHVPVHVDLGAAKKLALMTSKPGLALQGKGHTYNRKL